MKNKEYLSWFVGFVDAEGNFYTNKKFDTQTFSIHLSIRDKENLYKLKDFLKFGEVYEDPKNERVLFTITKKETLYNFLVPIFEEYPLLTRKFYQYKAWKEILEKRINKEKFEKKLSFQLTAKNDKTIEDLINLPYFEDWLIGFIEGEGSFMVINQNNKTLRPKFNICQKYDKIILEAIKKKLNTNVKIYLEKEDFYRLIIGSKKDLISLIQFLENSKIKFQGYKGEQYINWYNKISTLKNYQICLDKPIL